MFRLTQFYESLSVEEYYWDKRVILAVRVIAGVFTREESPGYTGQDAG